MTPAERLSLRCALGLIEAVGPVLVGLSEYFTDRAENAGLDRLGVAGCREMNGLASRAHADLEPLVVWLRKLLAPAEVPPPSAGASTAEVSG